MMTRKEIYNKFMNYDHLYFILTNRTPRHAVVIKIIHLEYFANFWSY